MNNRRMTGNKKAMRDIFIDRTLINNTRKIAELQENLQMLMKSDLGKIEIFKQISNNITVELQKLNKSVKKG
jgi:hypothetical protein